MRELERLVQTVMAGMVEDDRSLRRPARRWSDEISGLVRLYTAVGCPPGIGHDERHLAVTAHMAVDLTNDSRTHSLDFGLSTRSALLQNYGAAYVAVFLVSRHSLLNATAFSLRLQSSYAVRRECGYSSC